MTGVAAAIEGVNRDRLLELFAERDGYEAQAPPAENQRYYVLGRIDEFCAQNAIDEQEVADLYAAWVAERVL